jgi:hypothetical protein
MLLGDAGMLFISPTPCGRKHEGLYTPTSYCGHVFVDTQSEVAELQRWPVPKGVSLPSGPGGEGGKDCP